MDTGSKTMNEDNTAVAACLQGGGEEFKTVVDTYKGQLMAAAINILGNRQDAEDVCQETFVQVFRNRTAYDPSRSFRNWIYTILYRRCLDTLKRKRRFREAAFRMTNELPRTAGLKREPPHPASGGVSEKILDLLSAKERTAVVLWASEGFSAVEIAGILGCSASTARVTLFNARKKLKSSLEKYHGSY
jgi:RNA polymerase sigma-70 factor, ECF subfamily